jgi:hypothetical protein
VVDTTVRPPAAPPSDDTSTHKPRRRWLWWLLAAVLVALLAAASTGVILVTNYQPFVPGYKQYGPPAGVSSTVMRVPWLGLPPNLRIFRVPAEEGLTFNYRFSIWNHGPVPITVTRIQIPESEQAGEGAIIKPVAIYPNLYKIPDLGGGWRPSSHSDSNLARWRVWRCRSPSPTVTCAGVGMRCRSPSRCTGSRGMS